MNKLFYPAIFHKADEGGFWITFPDIPECMSQGEDMEQAYEMAVDALGLAITSRKELNVYLFQMNYQKLLKLMDVVTLENIHQSFFRF